MTTALFERLLSFIDRGMNLLQVLYSGRCFVDLSSAQLRDAALKTVVTLTCGRGTCARGNCVVSAQQAFASLHGRAATSGP
jgi:hypothetical protein